MTLTVESYLEGAMVELKNWENEKENPKWDGSIRKSCYLALIDHKIRVFREVVDYLKTIPKGTVLSTNVGLTEYAQKYYDLVNR